MFIALPCDDIMEGCYDYLTDVLTFVVEAWHLGQASAGGTLSAGSTRMLALIAPHAL
jgi:hypothetical protein